MNTPTQPATIRLPDHYNKKRVINARPLTHEELVANPAHVLFVSHCNTIARAKVLSIKTWKTKPGVVLVSLKYGLYEFFKVEFNNGQFDGETLVAEI